MNAESAGKLLRKMGIDPDGHGERLGESREQAVERNSGVVTVGDGAEFPATNEGLQAALDHAAAIRTPYAVFVESQRVGSYGFTRALIEVRAQREKHPRKLVYVVNEDRCDGDYRDGQMEYFDGLTASEREAIEEVS